MLNGKCHKKFHIFLEPFPNGPKNKGSSVERQGYEHLKNKESEVVTHFEIAN